MARYAPWKQDVPPWITVLEGLVPLLIGIFLVIRTDTAESIVHYLLGAALLIASLLELYAGFKEVKLDGGMAPWRLVRGGAGVAVAVLVLIAPWTEAITQETARLILGWGLVAFGLIGVLGLIFSGMLGKVGWSTLLLNILTGVLGATLLYNQFYNETGQAITISGTKILGWVAILTGGIMVVFGLYKMFFADDEPEPAPAAVVAPATAMDQARAAQAAADAREDATGH